MADKLLKKKARKVAPKKAPVEAQKRVVLVGTYKGDQLTAWPGWYNYPISAKDKIDVENANEIMPDFAATLAVNHPNANAINEDMPTRSAA